MASPASSDDNSPINNSESSRLLGLPPELRNKIYREVLVANYPLETHVTKAHRVDISSWIHLLHVCRQIRAEAHDIYWSENAFQFTTSDLWTTSTTDFLIPGSYEQAALINRLTFVLEPSKTFRTFLFVQMSTQRRPVIGGFGLVSLNTRRLLACGILPSSIRLVDSPILDSNATRFQHLLARMHEEFNQRIKDVLAEPALKAGTEIGMDDYQATTSKSDYRARKAIKLGTRASRPDAYFET